MFKKKNKTEEENQKEEEQKSSPTGWVDYILKKGIHDRASDIHLAPEREKFNFRLRIDGFLYTIENIDKYFQEGIISRIKVLSQMDITEHRFPQDGHFEFPYKEKVYNVRVATFPSIYGEVIVLRILNREDILIRLESLGFTSKQLKIMNKLITSPHGMILVTGPSGSGKTTLLYSILNVLRKPSNNIVTMEDPVEFEMANIRQLQVNESLGLTFSRAMRGILRQDPDIIMLGEIRDDETAQMAIQVGLTGVLVFSTLHTLNVPGVVARLLEMGMPRSVLASALGGVVLTRLIRKVCFSCNKEYQLSSYEKEVLGIKNKNSSSYNFQKGTGCKTCHNSGYLGRTGIFEIIPFDEDVKLAILSESPVTTLREILQKKKIKTLWDCGVEKVFQGITTIDELIRVLGAFKGK